MELSKKTTILFPPELHEQLVRLAKARGCSMGQLVRSAVRKQYGMRTREERIEAASFIAEMQLPVDDVETMIEQSHPPIDLPE